MALEQPDKDAYTTRIDTDIKTAKEVLDGQIGTEGVDIDKAIKAAKATIDTSRGSIVSSLEGRGTKGSSAVIEETKFIKIINDKAKEAIGTLDGNTEKYKKQHEGHIGFAKVQAELLDPELNHRIWNVVNKVEGERGEEKVGDFHVNVTSFPELQALEMNLRGLRDFCDEARTVRFAMLEPKAEELKRLKTNLGTADPALTGKIDAMLTSVNEKIDGFKKAEGLYDTKLAEVKKSLSQQIQREAAKERQLFQASGALQEKAHTKGGVPGKELTDAYAAWKNQKKFVKSLQGYVDFVGEKQTTGYGEQGEETSSSSTGKTSV